MEVLFWTLVAGIVGTVFIDVADRLMAQVKFTTGYS